MAQLEQLFAAGVRFDREVEYSARHKESLRYQKLPVLRSASARDRAFTTALQCVAVVSQSPIRQLRGEAGRLAQQALHADPYGPDAASMLQCIQRWNTGISATVVSSAAPAEIGQAALQALQAGGVAMVHYASAAGNSWATVIGMELTSGHGKVRTLLLLDSSGSEPWACAHNARLALTPLKRPGSANPAYPLVCRHLTGESERLRLLGIISLKFRGHSNDL